jgi:hypothetical protein
VEDKLDKLVEALAQALSFGVLNLKQAKIIN